MWGNDYPLGDEYLKKKYWGYHDFNCEESTRDIKDRITKELIWKLQSENKHGTTTKV
jgi:hypothetical protein